MHSLKNQVIQREGTEKRSPYSSPFLPSSDPQTSLTLLVFASVFPDDILFLNLPFTKFFTVYQKCS